MSDIEIVTNTNAGLRVPMHGGGFASVPEVALINPNGDPFACGVSPATPLKKAMIEGSGVSIPTATAFAGISVTGILALAFARFYDGANASGEFFMQMGLTTLGQQVLPQSIELTNGLYVAPSALFTGKFWVLYR